jgi:hypothetical protein
LSKSSLHIAAEHSSRSTQKSVMTDVEAGALEQLASNVRVIERNNGALAAMVAQAGAAEPRELRLLLQDTGALARETGERLVGLQGGPGAAKLNADFQFVLRRFRQLAEQSAHHARRKQSAPAPWGEGGGGGAADGGDGSWGALLPSAAEEERGGLLEEERKQQATKQQRAAQAREAAAATAERERMISQVEQTVGEVNEIFKDLAGLVSEQSEHIEHISSSIENTVSQAARAKEQLRLASLAKGRLRSLHCWLGLIVVLFVTLLVLMWSR